MKILFGLSLLWAYWNVLLLWSQPRARAASDEPRLDWAEGAFISLVGVAVLVGIITLGLSLTGIYSLWTLALTLCGFSLLLVLGNRPRKLPRFARGGYYEIGLVLLLACCAPLYFRPHEYILGWADAGTYMNIGVHLAQTGHWVVQDEFAGWLSRYGPSAFYQVPANVPGQWQFFGWYNHPVFTDRIFPQFFPLHPCFISIGILLAGIWGGLYVTPIWALLAIAAVYFATRTLFNRPVALLSALFLALTPTQVFFSRYPTAEPLTLLLLFTGILAYQRLQDDGNSSRLWAFWAAGTFGGALLTRIDLPLLVILIFLHLGILKAAKRWNSNWTTFLWSFAAFLGGAVLFGYFWGWMYIANTYGFILRNDHRTVITAGVLMLALPLGAYLVLRSGYRPVPMRTAGLLSGKNLRRGTAILLAGLSFYAYFLRPDAQPLTADNRVLADWNSLNWVRLGWYLTPLGLLLSTLGLVMIIWKEKLTRLVFFLSLGVLTTIQYTYKSQITPYHIYAMRRYVPLVLPVLIIFAAWALYRMYRREGRSWWKGLAVVLSVSLALGLVYQGRHLFLLRDLQGVVQGLTRLAQKIAPGSIILINDHEFADRFGVPLKYTFGFDVATLRRDDEKALPYLEQLVRRAGQTRQKIYLLAVNPLSPTVKGQLIRQPLFLHPLLLRMLKNTFTAYPRLIEETFYGVETYAVLGLARDFRDSPGAPADLEIDLGGFDSGYIQSGFFGKEYIPGFPSMRWTQGTSVLEFPNEAAQGLGITVRAMTLLPAKYPAPRVDILLDGQKIGHFTPTRNWETYRLAGQAHPRNRRTELTFLSETFTPKAIGLNQDTRELGFLLDQVVIRFAR